MLCYMPSLALAICWPIRVSFVPVVSTLFVQTIYCLLRLRFLQSFWIWFLPNFPTAPPFCIRGFTSCGSRQRFTPDIVFRYYLLTNPRHIDGIFREIIAGSSLHKKMCKKVRYQFIDKPTLSSVCACAKS